MLENLWKSYTEAREHRTKDIKVLRKKSRNKYYPVDMLLFFMFCNGYHYPGFSQSQCDKLLLMQAHLECHRLQNDPFHINNITNFFHHPPFPPSFSLLFNFIHF